MCSQKISPNAQESSNAFAIIPDEIPIDTQPFRSAFMFLFAEKTEDENSLCCAMWSTGVVVVEADR